jgi:hypothetical protein
LSSVSHSGGRVGKILIVLAATAISLALVELVCYLWLPVQTLRIFTSMVADDAVVGTIRNDRSTWKTAEYSVSVRLNAAGYREDFEFELSDLDVAFMGDSFAFGQGVEAAERYTAIAASFFPGKKMASLSYPNGWQPEHYEYFLSRHPELKPRVLVVGLYLGNDLDADVKETRITRDARGYIDSLQIPGRRIYDGYMVSRDIYPAGLGELAVHSYAVRVLLTALNASAAWRQYLVRRNPRVYPPNLPNTLETELGRLGEFGNRAFESLERIRAIAADRGSELLVLVIPQNFYVAKVTRPHIAREYAGRLDEILRSGGLKAEVLRRCEKTRLACIDPTPLLDANDYFAFDAHWTASGHRKVGNWLAEKLKAY